MVGKMKWQQVSRQVAIAWRGRCIWVSDGVLGYARPLAQGETLADAVRDFEQAGEPAVEAIVFVDGE